MKCNLHEHDVEERNVYETRHIWEWVVRSRRGSAGAGADAVPW